MRKTNYLQSGLAFSLLYLASCAPAGPTQTGYETSVASEANTLVVPPSTETQVPIQKYQGVESHITNGTELITGENALSPEQLQIVESIKEKYGIQTVSPVFWDGKTNLVWTTNEMEILADTIQKLPPSYLKGKMPEYIYLVKPKGTVGSAGGESVAAEYIFFCIPSDGAQTKDLKVDIVHEFTHNRFNTDLDTQKSFEVSVGWYQDPTTLIWKNIYPEFLQYTWYSDYPSFNPLEDLSETVGFAYTDPSKLDQKRIDFLLTNPAFDGWEAIDSLR